MQKRNPILVLVFGIITVIFYSWYWLIKTKGEMNKQGEKIPTAFIWLIPIVGGIWWLWKYSEAASHVTGEKLNNVLAFVVLWLLGPIGTAIVQDYFNKVESGPALPSMATNSSPASPVMPPANAMPANQPVNVPILNANSQPAAAVTPSPETPPIVPAANIAASAPNPPAPADTTPKPPTVGVI